MIIRANWLTLAVMVHAAFLCGPTRGEQPQSPAAQKAKAEFEERIEKLDMEYAAKFRELADQYALELARVRKAALDRGDLDEAQRILAVEKEIESEGANPKASARILYALWGAEDKWGNVTAQVQGMVKNSLLVLIPDKAGFPDTAFGRRKSLVLVYVVRGRVFVHVAGDTQAVRLQLR